MNESWLRLEGEGGEWRAGSAMKYGIFQNVDSKMSHGIFQEVGGFFAEDFGDGVAEGLVWHYR